jgi:hypothetical protein
MRTLTLTQLAHSDHGYYYVLPLAPGDPEVEQKVRQLLEKKTPLIDVQNIEQNGWKFNVDYLYEGISGFYPFRLEIEVAQVRDRLLFLITVLAKELLDDIIQEIVLPRWVNTLGLLKRLKD